MTTDLAEAGLERLICEALTGDPCEPASGGTVGEPSPGYGGGGWSPGNRHDYDREYCVDLCQLCTFLHVTQPESAAALCLGEDREELDPKTLGAPPDGAGGSGGGRVGSSRRVGSGSSSVRRSGSIRCLGLLGPIKKPSPRQIAERTIVGEIRTLATGCKSTGRKRLIEVKGVQGIFKENASVVLTARQVHDAVQNDENAVEYWLYVVDSTETECPRVFPIPWT